jgi:hypothetical protein
MNPDACSINVAAANLQIRPAEPPFYPPTEVEGEKKHHRSFSLTNIQDKSCSQNGNWWRAGPMRRSSA